MKVAVVDINGKETGREVTLSSQVYGLETPNKHAIYLDVKQYLANQRQGTHKVKERAEITGSTRKIKKQKGTGTARAGSIKSPLFKGGGTIFGPRPRNYGIKLNKNVKRLARKSALTLKAAEGAVKVVENFSFDAPKTKSFAAVVGALGLDAQKALFVLGDVDTNVYLSSRNLPKVEVVKAQDLNTYQVMNAKTVVFLETALEQVEATLS